MHSLEHLTVIIATSTTAIARRSVASIAIAIAIAVRTTVITSTVFVAILPRERIVTKLHPTWIPPSGKAVKERHLLIRRSLSPKTAAAETAHDLVQDAACNDEYHKDENSADHEEEAKEMHEATPEATSRLLVRHVKTVIEIGASFCTKIPQLEFLRDDAPWLVPV